MSVAVWTVLITTSVVGRAGFPDDLLSVRGLGARLRLPAGPSNDSYQERHDHRPDPRVTFPNAGPDEGFLHRVTRSRASRRRRPDNAYGARTAATTSAMASRTTSGRSRMMWWPLPSAKTARRCDEAATKSR